MSATPTTPGHTHLPADAEKLKRAVRLLESCESGFSAYIMGRKMKRKERNALLSEISAFLSETRQPTRINNQPPQTP